MRETDDYSINISDFHIFLSELILKCKFRTGVTFGCG